MLEICNPEKGMINSMLNGIIGTCIRKKERLQLTYQIHESREIEMTEWSDQQVIQNLPEITVEL